MPISDNGTNDGFGGPPVPARDIAPVVVAEEMLLLDKHHRVVHRLNSTASVMWAGLEAGESEAGLVESLGRVMQVDAATARAHVRWTLAEWRRLGVLAPSRGPETGRLDPPGERPPGGISPLDILDILDILDAVPECIMLPVTIANLRIIIHCGDLELYRVALSVVVPPCDRAPPADEGTVVRVSIARHRDHIVVAEGRVVKAVCPRLENLAPLLKGYLLHLAMIRGSYALAVHAAALESPAGDLLLLVGDGGTGKSTVAAALTGTGWRCLSDDISFLDDLKTLVAQDVPLAISVKRSGDRDRDPPLPGVDQAPWGRLADGREVRFLPPGPATAAPRTAAAARRYLVFVVFQPRHPHSMRRLTGAEALQHLLVHVRGMEGGLDARRLRRLARGMEGTATFAMSFPDLDHGLAELQRLVEEPAAPGGRDDRH